MLELGLVLGALVLIVVWILLEPQPTILMTVSLPNDMTGYEILVNGQRFRVICGRASGDILLVRRRRRWGIW